MKGQKLSAMRYIKNNKRRVAVLAVSLCLCMVLTYLTNFLLLSTEETFKVVLLDNSKKIQYVSLAGSSIGVDITNTDTEALRQEYIDKHMELAEKLKKYEGVKDTYYTYVIYNKIVAALGEWGIEVPLVEASQLDKLIEHYGAGICEGRMPENPGELVFDKASMSNTGYKVGDYFDEENCGTTYKIVGMLDSESYWGCGIKPDKDWENTNNMYIVILSDGSIEDVSKLLEQEGIYVRETYDTVVDVKHGKHDIKIEITDVISTSTSIVYIFILILLSISLFIVYTTYLRDRHDEWCLYCSIGYSRGEIYRSILRELAFSFCIAIVGGMLLIAISVLGIDYLMLKPAGLQCRYLYTDTIVEILCSYALLFGILQVPVRYALYKIRTIDAIDDELM